MTARRAAEALRRTGTVAVGAAVALVLVATAALAHVTVSSTGAVQGGYATVTVKVPTESDTASTVGLKLQLPTDTPLASVSIQPKAGWTYTTESAKLDPPIQTDDGPLSEAVSVITWTATAGGIKPGEFDTFDISVGPLPKKSSVVFKAIQTYSDGKVVQWVEQSSGSAEPDYPAPTLALAPASAAEAGAASAPAPPSTASGSSGGSDGLAVTGLVLGALGLVAGGAALGLVLRRRTPTEETP